LVAKENEGTAKLVADLDASNKKLADLEVAFNALSSEKAELLKQISELSAKSVSASVEAAKIASSVGVSPVELSPSDKSSDEPVKAVNHLEHFLSLPMGAERSAYFAKHKNEIVRSI
jgi:seryl-tRNA synthetase